MVEDRFFTFQGFEHVLNLGRKTIQPVKLVGTISLIDGCICRVLKFQSVNDSLDEMFGIVRIQPQMHIHRMIMSVKIAPDF